MNPISNRRSVVACALLGATAALAACATKAPPPPAMPAVVVPPQPRPPLGAAPNLATPLRDAAGLRHTVNAGITAAQATWNLRSAYNVAALNCLKPEHAAILDGYKEFLKTQNKKLLATNKAVDAEFKSKAGKTFIKAREAYMTQVYNYFALPPTLPAFCDAVLTMSQAARPVKSADLDSFAATGLSQLDQVFLEFFNSYDQYRVDLANWQSRYTPPTAMSAVPSITLPQPAAKPQ